jgi:hypothetical protein
MTVDTLSFTGELVVTSCWCGITLAVPRQMYRWAQNDHKHHIYCPLGHTFVYGKNETDLAKERAENLAIQLRNARTSTSAVRDQLQAERRSNAAYRGWITRLRNRIANGVCPVADCHRHFDDVQAHIQTQHPDWASKHPEALA